MERVKNFYRFFLTLMIIILTILVFIKVGQNQAESDTLWHIKAGEWILANGIPYNDPFSWTMQGKSWFAHEWLWEVCAAYAYRLAGPTGIWLFTCIWVAVFCSSLWLLIKKRCDFHRAALLYTFTIISCSVFWNARPHPMAQALFALTLLILLNLKDKPKGLVLLPFITLIWANMHGSAPLGVILPLFFWLTCKIKFNLPFLIAKTADIPLKTQQFLGITVLAAFAASLVNPHGINLWPYMFNVAGDPLMTKTISEWSSPNFQVIYYCPIIIISLIFFSTLILKSRTGSGNLSLFEFCITCGFFILALQQERHTPYFYFTSALLIGSLLGPKEDRQFQFGINFKVLAAIFTITSILIFSWLKPPTWIKENRFFPVVATQHLLQLRLVDNIFNQYGYGGYLIWYGIRPFIDGRADLYTFNSEIYHDYLDLTTNAVPGEKKLFALPDQYFKKYNIKTVFIAAGTRLDLYLVHHPNWREVYRDNSAVIYQKR